MTILGHGSREAETQEEIRPCEVGPKHEEHFAWLIDQGYADLDEGMPEYPHHAYCRDVQAFGLPELKTAATGKEGPKGRNVAIYPDKRDGVWRAVRYDNMKEPTWPDKTGNGHAMCLVGLPPPITVGTDLDLAVRSRSKPSPETTTPISAAHWWRSPTTRRNRNCVSPTTAIPNSCDSRRHSDAKVVGLCQVSEMELRRRTMFPACLPRQLSTRFWQASSLRVFRLPLAW